jgi:alkylation response protein AidB-like acyl-CoA dehydrogenase
VTLWEHLSDPVLGAELRDFCRDEVTPVADDIDRRDVYPTELVQSVAARGWNSMLLGPEYSGTCASMTDVLAVFEELSVGSGALGISLITIFQTQKIVDLYGSDELRDELLPRYTKGLRTSFALTEPGRGSDIRSVDTRAERRGDGWVLRGEKAFITSGSAADVFLVLAQTDAGPTTFVVPREAEGVTTHETTDAATFGLRNGPHVNLVLEDVEVPGHCMVGEEGRGLKQAMVTLANSRTLAAGISLGLARAAFDGALEFAHGRKAFDSRVIDFQGIQWYFAEMAADIDAARLLTYRAAADLDAGRDIARSSSAAKLVASRVATKVSETAVQICGAKGTRTSEPFGRYLRDAKAYEVAGGSSEILKNTIAKSILRELESAADDAR